MMTLLSQAGKFNEDVAKSVATFFGRETFEENAGAKRQLKRRSFLLGSLFGNNNSEAQNGAFLLGRTACTIWVSC